MANWIGFNLKVSILAGILSVHKQDQAEKQETIFQLTVVDKRCF